MSAFRLSLRGSPSINDFHRILSPFFLSCSWSAFLDLLNCIYKKIFASSLWAYVCIHINVQKHARASCVYLWSFSNVYAHVSTDRFLFLFWSGECPQSHCLGFWVTHDLSSLNSSGECAGTSKAGVKCHPLLSFFFLLFSVWFPPLS